MRGVISASGVGPGAVRTQLRLRSRQDCVVSGAMGRTLEFMDIHSPTVPQRPLNEAVEDLNDLLDEKIVLEETLGRFAEILETHGVGMSWPT